MPQKFGTKYTEAWARQQYQPEKERFTVEQPPGWVKRKAEHGDMSEFPEAVIQQEAPTLQGGGEIYTDARSELFGQSAPSTLIDKTLVRGYGTDHQTPAVKGHGVGAYTQAFSKDEPRSRDFARTPGYGRGFLAIGRGDDLGAPKDQTSQPPKYLFFHEQWFGLFHQGMEPPPVTRTGSDPVLQRGLNAYPVNDGPGRAMSWTVNVPSWKRGVYFQSNVQRDFNPPHRTHTNFRMVKPDVVTIIGDAPPPKQATKYDNAWSSLEKFMPKARHIRGIRRQPTPFDEGPLTRNYTTPASADYDSYVTIP